MGTESVSKLNEAVKVKDTQHGHRSLEKVAIWKIVTCGIHPLESSFHTILGRGHMGSHIYGFIVVVAHTYVLQKDGPGRTAYNYFVAGQPKEDNNSSELIASFERKGISITDMDVSGVASAKCFYQHISRQNSLTQARRNISRHYDLSNELFALFLDDTMTYSCAVFKARVKKSHRVLEIGCGWGTLAIKLVKRTGCSYTGITKSEEQLKYAENKVKEAGLQDQIRFLLCDYRQVPETYKYDRIISCEMLEAVGHEYMEEFFGCCESILADDGLFVVTSAMPASSRRLCVEHVENIGIHYYHTLRYWMTNFLEKQSKIRALGFDQKFIGTWEYYFDYCAAGFKTHTLGDYQVVFSKPGNSAELQDPYEDFPSANSLN
nr:cyclopropane-fatty-acyl-phospholipid synthase [Tanacetum cinerariifolium]